MDIFACVDRDSGSPLYEQIGRSLRAAIASEHFPAHAALPTERALADGFGVSRITIRKALGQLEKEGLLLRRQGAGTFVAPGSSRIEKSLSRITSFSEDMRARGLQPSSAWIAKAAGIVTPEEALALGLSPGSGIYRLTRIRSADGLPMALESSVLPASCLPAIENIGASLYEALDKHGNRPWKALQRLRAVSLDEARAAQLGVVPGAPALLIERRSFARSGAPIEVTTAYYRGDAYDFLTEITE